MRQVIKESSGDAPATLPAGVQDYEEFKRQLAEGSGQVVLRDSNGEQINFGVVVPPKPSGPVTPFTIEQVTAARAWTDRNKGVAKGLSQSLLNETDTALEDFSSFIAAAEKLDGGPGGFPLHQLSLALMIKTPDGLEYLDMALQGMYTSLALWKSPLVLRSIPGAEVFNNKVMIFAPGILQAVTDLYQQGTTGAGPQSDISLTGTLRSERPAAVDTAPTAVPGTMNESKHFSRKKYSLKRLMLEAPISQIVDDALEDLLGAESKILGDTLSSRVFANYLLDRSAYSGGNLDDVLARIDELVSKAQAAGEKTPINDEELKIFIKDNASQIFTPEIISKQVGSLQDELTVGAARKSLKDLGVDLELVEDVRPGASPGSKILKLPDNFDPATVSKDSLLGQALDSIEKAFVASDGELTVIDRKIIGTEIAQAFVDELNETSKVSFASVKSRITDRIRSNWLTEISDISTNVNTADEIVGGYIALRDAYKKSLATVGLPVDTRFPIVVNGQKREVLFLRQKPGVDDTMQLIDDKGNVKLIDFDKYATVDNDVLDDSTRSGLARQRYLEKISSPAHPAHGDYADVLDRFTGDYGTPEEFSKFVKKQYLDASSVTVPLKKVQDALRDVGYGLDEKARGTLTQYSKMVDEKIREVIRAADIENVQKTPEQWAEELAKAVDTVNAEGKTVSPLLNPVKLVRSAAKIPEGFFQQFTASFKRAWNSATENAGNLTGASWGMRAGEALGSMARDPKETAYAFGRLLAFFMPIVGETVNNAAYGALLDADLETAYKEFGAHAANRESYEKAANNAIAIAERIREVYGPGASIVGTQGQFRASDTADTVAAKFISMAAKFRTEVDKIPVGATIPRTPPVKAKSTNEARILRMLIRETLR